MMKVAFKRGLPVWITGREKDMNLRVQFKTVVRGKIPCEICIATSGVYQLWVNGRFVAFGPARAGRRHFRVDRLALANFLTQEDNVLVIEVAGYNVNAFNMLNQPSFLQAEVIRGETVIAATGFDFTARMNPYYYRKMQRYGHWRPMVESYCYKEPADDYLTNPQTKGFEILNVVESGQTIERYAPYQDYEYLSANPISYGTVEEVELPENQRTCSGMITGEKLLGFLPSELDVLPTEEWQHMRFVHGGTWRLDMTTDETISDGQYRIYALPHNASGFVRFTICCQESLTLYVAFDERMQGCLVDCLRMPCASVIRYDLCPGTHELQFFEVYTMKFLQFIVKGGSCKITSVGMVQYQYPMVTYPKYENVVLQKISDAAIETFRQNSVDIFMDCPSRERAGWLCDSFFMGRTEHFLTGKNLVEKSFLENFLHEEHYEFLPEGMFPECYPAEHYTGGFIPNWAMWLVLQLKDYLQRSGDVELVERFRDKVIRLFHYLADFENEDGLLEKLPGWVFVEWSKANDFVQDVNYPSNMIYYAALQAASELYDIDSYRQKAYVLKQKILEQSFDGEFFTDHAVRREGVLYHDGERTEVCQYYAFFTGIADAESHGALLETMVNHFGPQGIKGNQAYMGVHPAAPFVGNYLRLELLLQYGYHRKLLEDIEGYFLHMAEETGTLWESAPGDSSCNHGFASYVAYWLYEIIHVRKEG